MEAGIKRIMRDWTGQMSTPPASVTTILPAHPETARGYSGSMCLELWQADELHTGDITRFHPQSTGTEPTPDSDDYPAPLGLHS